VKIELWWIGKTKVSYLEKGVGEYLNRLKHYCSFSTQTIADVKNSGKLSPAELKKKEGESVLSRLDSQSILILLDERGKTFTSSTFAEFIQNKMNQSTRKIVFLIGGAYGFDEALYQRADQKMALSAMTFSHQMIRLFFVEQLYRAFTIINNEKYHNS
jgi:23S rRNA (pseudouridine1915-N3)-methyltransferase